MRKSADRLRQIESLLDLLGHLGLEPEASVKLETDLLIAYALTRIESRLEAVPAPSPAERFPLPQRQ